MVRPEIQALKPYQPIEPLEVLSQRIGLPLESLIKLDGNENPYGCSPRVPAALAAYTRYHIYPDPFHYVLRDRIARYSGFAADRLIVGNGSDELIDLLCRTLINQGDEVIVPTPTFPMYALNTLMAGGRVVQVPRGEDFQLDIPAIERAIAPRTRIIFVASPNNPTANVALREDVRRLLQTGVLVVADEAYYEFCGQSVASLAEQYENLVVLRTFSKWAGLAGLRAGYGLFPAALREQVMKVKPPYNVSAAAQTAVLASLDDLPYLLQTVQWILAERERMSEMLHRLPFLSVYPSDANFVLCRVLEGKAADAQAALARKGIFVRHFKTPGIDDCLRISAGRPEHTDALVAELEAWATESRGEVR